MPRLCNRGTVYIHALKNSLVPHMNWTMRELLGDCSEITWQKQTARPGYLMAHISWQGGPDTAASIAAALRQIPDIWFEIGDRGSPETLPGWIMYTPNLGIFYSPTDHAGNFLVSEDRIRSAYEKSLGDPKALFDQFSLALGEAWNEELEPLRAGADASRVVPFPRLTK